MALGRIIAIAATALSLNGDVLWLPPSVSLWQDFIDAWSPPQRLLSPVIEKRLIDMIDVYPPFRQGNMLYRWAHFLGQCSHESDYFQKTTEDMNYSPHRLLTIFPRYFNPKNVDQYAWCPDKIANRAYANRMGNGDEQSGDGFRYRGRGFLQLTGKKSYAQFSQWMRHHDLVQHTRISPANCVRLPEEVSGRFCWLSAIFYFETRQLWPMCDQGIDPLTIAKISYAINGGFHGLQDRIAWTYWWYDSLKKACDQSVSEVR